MKINTKFYWGKTTEVVISGWPGQSYESYILAISFVFVLSLIVEWLSHIRLMKYISDNFTAGVVQSLMYGTRVGLAYLVMLAVMSYNTGILLAAIAGYSTGFLVFGCGPVLWKSKVESVLDPADLPPSHC